MKEMYVIIRNILGYFEDKGYTIVGVSNRSSSFDQDEIEYDMIVDKANKSVYDVIKDMEEIGIYEFSISSNGKDWYITAYGLRPDVR